MGLWKLTARDREAINREVDSVDPRQRMAARLRLQVELMHSRLHSAERLPTSAREWLRGRRGR